MELSIAPLPWGFKPDLNLPQGKYKGEASNRIRACTKVVLSPRSGRMIVAQQFTAGMESERSAAREADG
jgi:hypothetical protein